MFAGGLMQGMGSGYGMINQLQERKKQTETLGLLAKMMQISPGGAPGFGGEGETISFGQDPLNPFMINKPGKTRQTGFAAAAPFYSEGE